MFPYFETKLRTHAANVNIVIERKRSNVRSSMPSLNPKTSKLKVGMMCTQCVSNQKRVWNVSWKAGAVDIYIYIYIKIRKAGNTLIDPWMCLWHLAVQAVLVVGLFCVLGCFFVELFILLGCFVCWVVFWLGCLYCWAVLRVGLFFGLGCLYCWVVLCVGLFFGSGCWYCWVVVLAGLFGTSVCLLFLANCFC